jgi:hypothetical protein
LTRSERIRFPIPAARMMTAKLSIFHTFSELRYN